MLLIKYGKKASTPMRLVVGQFTLITGLAGVYLGILTDGHIHDFLRGFCLGLGIVSVIVSLFFNLSVFPRVRERFGLES